MRKAGGTAALPVGALPLWGARGARALGNSTGSRGATRSGKIVLALPGSAGVSPASLIRRAGETPALPVGASPLGGSTCATAFGKTAAGRSVKGFGGAGLTGGATFGGSGSFGFAGATGAGT